MNLQKKRFGGLLSSQRVILLITWNTWLVWEDDNINASFFQKAGRGVWWWRCRWDKKRNAHFSSRSRAHRKLPFMWKWVEWMDDCHYHPIIIIARNSGSGDTSTCSSACTFFLLHSTHSPETKYFMQKSQVPNGNKNYPIMMRKFSHFITAMI